MHFVATCIRGVESLVRAELERQKITVTYGQDCMVGFEGDDMTFIKANLWSRVANHIYIEVKKAPIFDLESFFETVVSQNWSSWIPLGTPIHISATSIGSYLTHTPTLQSLGKKAIIRSLFWGQDEQWNEDSRHHPVEIFFLLVRDELHVLVNTSWMALHKRGYRKNTTLAPMKESLAAALILFSGWKFSTPFFDPFCGSGTIPIEAALIARNIAPGLMREFDYLYFPWGNLEYHKQAQKEARAAIYEKSYQIFGYDIDPHAVFIASENAFQAGVGDTIVFWEKNFQDITFPSHAHCVTNPPYGKRMTEDNIGELYHALEKMFYTSELSGGIITSYDSFPQDGSRWSKKNLMNGGEKCQFWRKTLE